MPTWLRLCRLLISLVAFAALVAQGWHGVTVLKAPLGHFLSYFTVHSNFLAALVLLMGALLPRWTASLTYDLLRGAAVLYLLITGVIYSLLLAHLPEVIAIMVPWCDVVLHRVMPLWMLIDWLVAPPHKSLTFWRALVWLGYPAVFIPYTLVRGAVVKWHPYPFLNPGQPGGVLALAGYCAGITVFTLLLIWLVVKVGGLRQASSRELSRNAMKPH